jgi:hypothetical protein
MQKLTLIKDQIQLDFEKNKNLKLNKKKTMIKIDKLKNS